MALCIVLYIFQKPITNKISITSCGVKCCASLARKSSDTAAASRLASQRLFPRQAHFDIVL